MTTIDGRRVGQTSIGDGDLSLPGPDDERYPWKGGPVSEWSLFRTVPDRNHRVVQTVPSPRRTLVVEEQERMGLFEKGSVRCGPGSRS